MSAVKVDSVNKWFADAQVLHDVHLDVPHGAVIALLGPSGCGKTTLLRLIAGFERPDEGHIAFDGRNIVSRTHWVPPERRGIGYVPQEGTLFPHLTVEGNVRYGLPRGSRSGRRVQEVLDLTGLSDLGKRYPHEISGGQQQRVALARALAPGPALVLLDEPFNALDLDLRRSMCEDVIRLLRDTGTTTVLVTHDPGEAFAVSDQLAVMQAGKIMQYDNPERVYWKPANPSVARLTGPTLFLSGQCLHGHAVTPLGTLPIHASCTPPQGEAWIMLRPEQVCMAGGPGTNQNSHALSLFSHGDPTGENRQGKTIAARVTQRSFRGDHTILGVSVAGAHVSLRLPSLSAPASGTIVHLIVQGACMAYAMH